MNLFRLRRDIQDLGRLREIITILVAQGFHEVVAKARLSRHAKVAARVQSAKAPTTPRRVRETLEQLGPTFVKLGQVLSLRPDLIPQEYCDEFKRLQDGVAPLTFPVVKGVVESELKRPLSKVFKDFEEAPLAAASVGQVHKAVLKSGEHVVVKIQRPGVKQVMERDIDIMQYLAARLDRHFKELHSKDIVGEFQAYTERELDLRFEMRNVKRFHDFFRESEHVVIPAIHEELCTTHLLVLEEIKGVRVSDKAALHRAKYDLQGLARIGFDAMFRQCFELGAFHADPHPGNLIACRREGEECLAFIDFGIVGFLSEELQLHFLEFLDGITRKDIRLVQRSLLKIGERGPGFEAQAFKNRVSSLVLEWHGSSLQEEKLSLLAYKVIGSAISHQLQLPADVILVAKAFVTMEGAGAWLDPEMNITEMAPPLLKKLLHLRYGPEPTAKELFRDAREFRDLARELPDAAAVLMEKVEEGKVELSVDREEFFHAEKQYDLEMSRKNLALIAAAFFLGSALLAALAPELVVLGFPLWQLGFLLCFLTIAMLVHLTIKTHKYVERQA